MNDAGAGEPCDPAGLLGDEDELEAVVGARRA